LARALSPRLFKEVSMNIKKILGLILIVSLLIGLNFISFQTINSVKANGLPNEVWVDNDFNSSTPGWGVTHFDKIQDGINGVADSGTVHVAAGIYQELLTINKANLTLISGSPGTAVIKPLTERAAWPWGAVLITANGVTIDGFEIDGSTVCYNGINAYGVSNVKIKNNIVHGATAQWDGIGILVWDWDKNKTVDNATIENNLVYDTGRMGIFCMDYGNNIYDVTEGHIIRGNKVHDTWKVGWGDGGGGIQINVGKNCAITNNLIYNTQNNQRGIYMFGSAAGNTIVGNTLRNNGYGIQLWISGEDGATINWDGETPTSPAVHFNNIYDNSLFGAESTNIAGTPMVMDATNNWWGANDGPSGVGHGSGDAVSANVDYDPWLKRVSSTSTIYGDVQVYFTPGGSPAMWRVVIPDREYDTGFISFDLFIYRDNKIIGSYFKLRDAITFNILWYEGSNHYIIKFFDLKNKIFLILVDGMLDGGLE